MTKIKDVMTKKCEWIAPGATLAEAAKIMKSHDCGFLPVGENDRLIGSITDRDITVRAIAEGKDPKNTAVRDAMTSKIYYCFDDQDVAEVCRNMGDIKVRRLPVVNRDKQLVGIVSSGDVAQAASAEAVGECQQQITEGTGQKKAA